MENSPRGMYVHRNYEAKLETQSNLANLKPASSDKHDDQELEFQAVRVLSANENFGLQREHYIFESKSPQ